MAAPAFAEQLLASHSKDEWLDRRAFLDADQRKAAHLAFAQDWLRKHHPRFGGRAA